MRGDSRQEWSEGEREGEGGEREKGRERGREGEREGEEKRKEMRGEREVYVVCLGRRECIRAYKREACAGSLRVKSLKEGEGDRKQEGDLLGA